MLRKKKFIIGGLILLLALVYLGYTGFMGSATYYYTVSELTEKASTLNGQNVRVGGTVADNSIKQDGMTLTFTIVEAQKILPVTYQGVVPDTFKAGSDVVIEGRLNSSGIFEANNILPKCASKYEPTT